MRDLLGPPEEIPHKSLWIIPGKYVKEIPRGSTAETFWKLLLKYPKKNLSKISKETPGEIQKGTPPNLQEIFLENNQGRTPGDIAGSSL